MALALSSDFPILDILWTIVLAFGLGLLLWTIIVVFRDLFGRGDIAAWVKVLWVLAVFVFPIAGSLAYLITQSPAMGERRLARDGATDLRMDSYLHDRSGAGSYRGVRDVTRSNQVWSGPG
jgi:Phospholipase_D-nuclease N-terminal